jgi:electron transport complex protein RnfE
MEGAMTMSAAVLFVLVCANVMISLIRHLLKPHLRILVFTLTIAAFVTIADRVLAAFMYDMSKKLGPYIPLIIVNCIIIARCEICASKQGPGTAAMDAIGQSLGFTLGLACIATVREILGFGTWFGTWLGWHVVPASVPTGVWSNWVVMILPPGAFLTLGLLLGVFNWLQSRGKKA